MRLVATGVDWTSTNLDPIHDGNLDGRFPSISEARKVVRAKAVAGGCTCPCCGQYAKLYKRPMTSAMALALIQIYRHFFHCQWKGWLHVPKHLAAQKDLPPSIRASWHGGDWSKLRFWQLIEPKPEERQDGSTRVGCYRITDLGRQFVEREMKVPKYVYIYAQTFLGLDLPYVTIDEALGEGFDYRSLMRDI